MKSHTLITHTILIPPNLLRPHFFRGLRRFLLPTSTEPSRTRLPTNLSAGDDVILLELKQGMQESHHARVSLTPKAKYTLHFNN